MFGGMYAATLTPFDDSNRVDLKALVTHVEFLAKGGLAGVCPCGTTGEFLYLSLGEKVRVTEATVTAASGRMKVMAGISAMTTREIQLLARAAESAGADAVFLQPPIYYPASDNAIVAWYAAVREATSLPVFAYNIPQYAANSISPACLTRLVDDGIVAGIKDSTGKADRLKDLLDGFGSRITVMAASDAFAASARQLGAHGFISALANVWPAALTKVWSGDDSPQAAIDAARTAVKQAGGIPAIKYLLSRRLDYPPASRLPSPLHAQEALERLDAAAEEASAADLAWLRGNCT